MSVQRLSHIGICVSELERSVRFYRDVLGFEELSRLQVSGPESARLLQLRRRRSAGGVPAARRHPHRTAVLSAGRSPGVAHARAHEQAGTSPTSHCAWRISMRWWRRLRPWAAACLDETRIDNDAWRSKAVFVTDPDGLRIELLQAPGDPNALPGA